MPGVATIAPRFALALPDTAAAMDFAPDGRQLAVATLEGEVLLVDVDSGAIAGAGARHRGGALAVAWRPDGKVLASAGQDGKVCLTSVGGQALCRPFFRGWIEHLAWSPDGAHLAIGTGKVVHVVDASGETVTAMTAERTVAALAWLPDDKLALAGYGGVLVFGIGDGKPPTKLEWPGALLSMAASPDGTVIAAGCQEDCVQLWTWPSGKALQISGFDTKVRALAWDSSADVLATTGGTLITLWPFSGKGPEGVKPMVLDRHTSHVAALAFSGESTLVSIDEAGQCIRWGQQKRRRWQALAEATWNAPLLGLAISTTTIAVASQDAHLLLLPMEPSR
jgi:WD40 repeat protein